MSKYSFNLDDETKRFAETKIGENEEKRIVSIAKINEFLDDEPNLNARRDEYSILVFLRACKFDIEKTKKKMRNFYELRARLPEWFLDRNPNLPEINELLKIGVFVPITQTVPGPLLVIIRTAAHDPEKHKQNDVFKTGKMILDLALEEYEYASIYGIHAVFDMKNITYGHARQLNPIMIKNAVYAWQNYYSRPQKLEFVNAPIYINVMLNIFKSFMSQKMKERVHIHYSGFDELHKNISKDLLPEEYGGTNGSLQHYITQWHEKLIGKTQWFKDNEQFKAKLVTNE